MSFSVVTVTKWDGCIGYAEDAYGELHKFEYGDVNPEDVLSLEEGSKLIIPDEGYIELTTSAFSKWLDNEWDAYPESDTEFNKAWKLSNSQEDTVAVALDEEITRP